MKFCIYQVFPRYFGNNSVANEFNGSILTNGCGKFDSFTYKALSEIKNLGITHIWYTGVIEHATQTNYADYGILPDYPAIVKGKAGSPYAIKDYFDVDPDLARNVDRRMIEFEELVDRTHRSEMQVIIDFIPNHVARQYKSDSKPDGVSDLGEQEHSEWAFSPLNNYYYVRDEEFRPTIDLGAYTEYPAKATGNDVFHASPGINDWYETIKLNYGVNYFEHGQKQFDPIPQTWLRMREILLFWASKKVDGFRCDMVEMVPVEFWGWVIPQVKSVYPHLIFIAEVYQPSEYRNYILNGQFDYLYDKVGLYDTLRDVLCGQRPASHITYCWQSLSGIEHRMLNFLENHDEQRIASDFFCSDAMKARSAMIVCCTLNTSPCMIYSGQELGESGMYAEGFSGLDGRSTIFDYWGIRSIQQWRNSGMFDGLKQDSKQHKIHHFYSKLLNICMSEAAIRSGDRYDLVYANHNNPSFNADRQFAYCRKYEDELIVVVINFDDKPLDTSVCFPIDAFLYFELEETNIYKIENLMNSTEVYQNQLLSSTSLFRVGMIEANNGLVLKLTRI